MPESRAFQALGLRTNKVELTFGLAAGAGACAEVKVAASVSQESRISKENERSITFAEFTRSNTVKKAKNIELRLGIVLC
jgi:hypothetical protein